MNEEKQEKLAQTKTQLDQLAWLLDNAFQIPGLRWRFGIDAILGLIPGAGDLVSSFLGVFLLFRAFQYRLPGIVITRMILNSLIDLVVGSIPIAGDVFDAAWKSNTQNMKLFHKHAGEREKSTLKHWVFLGVLLAGFAAVFVLLIVAFLFIIHAISQSFHQGIIA